MKNRCNELVCYCTRWGPLPRSRSSCTTLRVVWNSHSPPKLSQINRIPNSPPPTKPQPHHQQNYTQPISIQSLIHLPHISFLYHLFVLKYDRNVCTTIMVCHSNVVWTHNLLFRSLQRLRTFFNYENIVRHIFFMRCDTLLCAASHF